MGETQRPQIELKPLAENQKAKPSAASPAQGTEHSQTEEAISALAAIVESSDDAIIGKTLEGIVTSWNRGAERIYGYGASEIIGQPISTIMPPELQDELPNILRKISSGERVEHYETDRVRKDGRRIHVSLTVSPIKNKDGRVIGASAVARDVTDSNQAEERLRKSEERLQAVIENLNEGLIVSDLDGNLLHWNRAALEMHDFASLEEGRRLLPEFTNIFELCTLDGATLSLDQWPLARIFRGERLRDVEVRIRRLGTDWARIFKYGGSIVHDPDGKPLAVITVSDISERKWAEEALRQNEEKLHLALESTKMGTWDLVPETGERNWSERCKDIYGLPPDTQIDAETIFERIHPEDRDYVYNSLKQALDPEGNRELKIEYRVLRDDTDIRWVEARGRTFSEEGNTRRIIGTLLDITERKRAEEGLRESESRLRLALDATKMGTWILNPWTKERRWSEHSKAIFGLPADAEVKEEELNRLIHPDDLEQINEALKQALQPDSSGELHIEFRILGDDKGRGLRWAESQGRVFFEDGRPVRLIGTLLDITERKQAEEKLREQARILDHAPVLVRDLSDRIIMWNTGAELMYGWTQEEALGQISHILFQTKLPQPIEEIEDWLYSHGAWKGELAHTRRDGRQLVIDSHWVLHRDAQGKAKAILEVNSDITERRRAEEEVRRLNEELEARVADRTAQLQAANKELEAFSYSVSHDLRAPLRHINGFSQALLEDYADELDEVAKGYLDEVRAASQEMAQLIDDVLELARVTRTEMRREPVDISRLAQDVIADLRRREPGREVSVNIEEGLMAVGDKRLLKIVLVNLFGNAWKFTSKREGAEISFGRTEHEDESAFYVRDNGAGFDMAYADKLFRTFQRLHTGSEFEGTGIGLATVMRIVSRHGGRVWAEGAVNQGASFYFTLPTLRESRLNDE